MKIMLSSQFVSTSQALSHPNPIKLRPKRQPNPRRWLPLHLRRLQQARRSQGRQ